MENDRDPPPVENDPTSGNNSVDPTEGIMYGDSSLPPQWKLIVAQLRSETEKYNEVRETYYEVYLDGNRYHDGTLESCTEYVLYALDDDCAEVYKVTVTEEKVVI